MPTGGREEAVTCPSCGADTAEGATYCAVCGMPVGVGRCPACSAELVPGGRFCASCGTAAIDAGVALPTESRARSADRDGAGLAERRRVSVLFVDLVDFTPLAEAMDPEEVRAVQARYFEVARSVVMTYGGTLEKFIGDAVMAVWGAPSAHEDDPERAVRAALALVYAVERIGGAASGQELRARAAVATGQAAVTLGASDQGIVAGDLVNIAARLQGRAPSGGVVVDRATREAASPSIEFARIGSLALKGRRGRLEAYRATSLSDEATVRSTSHTGRLVGRDRELREITELLGSVIAEGRGRLVSVTGIAGIGKSRLAWELDRWVDSHPTGIAWHDGRALAYGEGVAFSAVSHMVRRRARIDDAAPPEVARRQLASALEELIRDETERQWIEPRLSVLLSRDAADAFDRDELFAAWRRFFERVSELSPVVMVFEDLQWADPSLLDFVEHLATWARKRPIFVLTLARPELLDQRPTWGSAVGSFTAITVERLPDSAMRELLSERAPDVPAAFLESVLRDAGGVPLYAVEVARMLVDRGREGAPLPTEGSVPDSLRAIIAARLDALPLPERRLLLAAAVLGNQFRPEALHAVVGGDPNEVRSRLDGLVRREMLTADEELASPGRGQLTFVQDLVREVAYETVAHSERRAVHLAAARYLESLEADEPELLAAHLVEAHRLTSQPRDAERLAHRAVGALRRAARAASALHVPARALGLTETALGLADGSTRPLLLAEAADAARAAGHLEVAETHLRELIGQQQDAGERSAAARTRAQLASVMLTAQANEPALIELEAAMRDARRWQTDPSGVELAAQLARARSVMGDDREGLRWAERALAAAERLSLPSVITDLRITRGTSLIALGDHEPGLADLRAAIAQAQEAGMLRTELRARNNLAWGLLADDPIAAFETARLGLDLATEMGLADFVAPLADLACAAAIEAGSWDWALETVADLEERGVADPYLMLLSASAATIRALRGNKDALEAIERFEPLPPTTDSQVVAELRLARAWSAFLTGDLAKARILAGQAISGVIGMIHPHERAILTRTSLWMGDHEAVAAGVAELTSPVPWARAAHATVLTMEAGLAAISGDPRADQQYRRAREAWEELQLPLQLALCLLDQQRLMSDPGDASDLVGVLDRLGADGLLALLSPTMQPVRRPPRARVPGARSPRPSAGTARPTGAGRRSRPARGPRSPSG
jgi:class 3 adenylate cyclase